MLTWFENLGGPTALILIGAILGAFGAFWASHQQARKSDEIAKLNQMIATQQKQLNAKSDDIKTNIDRILNHLVAQGKITKEEAQRILNIKLEESMNFQENVKIQVTREPEVKKPQPD